MPTVTYGNYEWDAKKDAINRAEHRLGFLEATGIFDSPVLAIPAKSKNGEVRYKVIGLFRSIEIAIIYTQRGKRKRIISARRAKKKERRAYHLYCANPNDRGGMATVRKSH